MSEPTVGSVSAGASSDFSARLFRFGTRLARDHAQTSLRNLAAKSVGEDSFQCAVDNVAERLEVLIALAASPNYPIHRIDVMDRSEQIVLAVLAMVKKAR